MPALIYTYTHAHAHTHARAHTCLSWLQLKLLIYIVIQPLMLCLQSPERKNARLHFIHKAWWNIQHCWLRFVSNIFAELRWHFITSIVGTENYNINSILSQCPAVMIAKCPVKITFVTRIMVSHNRREIKTTLHWRHNDHDGVSNHQLHCCLLHRLKIKENIKAPRHWPLWGEFTGTGEFPAQRDSYAENVSIWWRHHETDSVVSVNYRMLLAVIPPI